MINSHNNIPNSNSQNDFEHYLAIIHDFSISVNKLTKVPDVFWLITKELSPKLNLLDCVIYEVNEKKKKLIQIAAVGGKLDSKDVIQNKLELNFGEGHVGKSCIEKQSLLIEDISLSPDYIEDLIPAGSEVVVPIIGNGKVIGVISSEHPEKAFYKDSHIKLFEIIAIIAAGAIQRIAENKGLSKIKSQLEEIIHQKSSDLDRVVEILSNQYSELKYQHEKMEILIQEVHHRVNNNLQIISSLLSLYSSEAQGEEVMALNNIKNRVQAMALIHQNIYKSVEMSTADVEAYVRDLMNHLRSVDETGVQCIFDFKSTIKFINLNTLVPFGLLLVEIFSKWMELCQTKKIRRIHFNISLEKNRMDEFTLLVYDDSSLDIRLGEIVENDSISAILISALVDQLEGDLTANFVEFNKLSVNFKEL